MTEFVLARLTLSQFEQIILLLELVELLLEFTIRISSESFRTTFITKFVA